MEDIVNDSIWKVKRSNTTEAKANNKKIIKSISVEFARVEELYEKFTKKIIFNKCTNIDKNILKLCEDIYDITPSKCFIEYSQAVDLSDQSSR
jgi:hypothetical protein